MKILYSALLKEDFRNIDSNFERLLSIQVNLSNIIETPKQQYFTKIDKKLSNNNVGTNTHWSILKSFLLGKNILCIVSIFQGGVI